MIPLQVKAFLASAIAVYDDWSPSLDSLLEWQILDGLGLACPNPTLAQVLDSRAVVDAHMPVSKLDFGSPDSWYWAVSAPCYQYTGEQMDRFRKRWQPGIDSPPPIWKGRAKIDTSAGAEKSYDLPLPLRSTPVISWFVLGDADGLLHLLNPVTGLGKKRSYGNGQVLRWEVVPCDEDWHLYRDGNLQKPIPVQFAKGEFAIRNWGWRPPAWLPDNKVLCAMPKMTVSKYAI